MQYIFDGELHKIVRITGPRHNMLALGFGEVKTSTDIEVLDLRRTDDHVVNFSPIEVKRQVLLGIKEINQELGTNYVVNKIQFVGSDSLSDTVYTELSKGIIRKLIAQEFKT